MTTKFRSQYLMVSFGIVWSQQHNSNVCCVVFPSRYIKIPDICSVLPHAGIQENQRPDNTFVNNYVWLKGAYADRLSGT